MRAVVDTNVWVSAAMTPGGHPAMVVAALLADRFNVVASPAILNELEEVFSRPRIIALCKRNPGALAKLLAAVRREHQLVNVTPEDIEAAACRDVKDKKFVATAFVARADALVSRDEDLTRAPEVAAYLAPAGVRILTVAHFLAELEAPPSTGES